MLPNGSPRLILASASPRRRKIVGRLGVAFEVVATEVDETLMIGEQSDAAARRIASSKARAAGVRVESGIAIGADTVVVLEGRILGKPATMDEAVSMLKALRGRSHEVITGLAVLDVAKDRLEQSSTTSLVVMRNFTEEEIATYVATGDPMDKAGAYAVQSGSFHPAATIIGCYLSVVGLPLCTLVESLCAVGHPLVPKPDSRLAGRCRSCLGGEISLSCT